MNQKFNFKIKQIDIVIIITCFNFFNRLNYLHQKSIKLLTNLREFIDPENYEAMVQGFGYLCLSGDKAMDENEYYILRCFFEPGYDYAPESWEQFKKEW